MTLFMSAAPTAGETTAIDVSNAIIAALRKTRNFIKCPTPLFVEFCGARFSPCRQKKPANVPFEPCLTPCRPAPFSAPSVGHAAPRGHA